MRILLTLTALWALTGFAAKEQPNFILILADDMGWTGTSVQVDGTVPDSRSDYYKTPNLEKFAKQAMVFGRAYSPGPMCTPSRAAIQTGKTPARLHMTAPGGGRTTPSQKVSTPLIVREFPEAETTMAEMLKKEGYSTAWFGKWHQGRESPGKHGFDFHDGPVGNDVPEPKDGPKDVFGVTERAINFIENQVKDGKPFFVQLSHWAVHGPFESSEASQKKFEASDKGKNHTDPIYAGMTFDLDVSIGSLLKKIDELKLSGNTYIIFMSDNGAPSSARQGTPQNAPLRAGKSTLYEGGIRVPLIISGPGIKPASSTVISVSGCDLYPTVGELAGVSSINKVDGSSLVPLLKGKKGFKRQNPLLFYYPHYGRSPINKPQAAIIKGSFKLVKNLESGTSELFNLDKDIGEANDLSVKMPEKMNELVKLMDRRLKAVDAQLMLPNPDYDPDAEVAAGPARGNAGGAGGRTGPAGPDEFMERFDKDKDGKITREEFDGPAPRWQRLDADGDGIVTKADVEANPGPRGRRPQQNN